MPEFGFLSPSGKVWSGVHDSLTRANSLIISLTGEENQ
jgi:hypothetical protein